MKIILNGEPRNLPAALSVQQLLIELKLQNKRLAVEINQQIIPSAKYSTHLLVKSDAVEIVQAIGGG